MYKIKYLYVVNKELGLYTETIKTVISLGFGKSQYRGNSLLEILKEQCKTLDIDTECGGNNVILRDKDVINKLLLTNPGYNFCRYLDNHCNGEPSYDKQICTMLFYKIQQHIEMMNTLLDNSNMSFSITVEKLENY